MDDAREISIEQAQAYQATGRKVKAPKPAKVSKLAQIKGPGAKAAEEVAVAPERVYIRLISAKDNDILMALKQTIDEHSGPTEVVLVLGPETGKQAIKLPTGMKNEDAALSKLQQLVGAENVKVR